MQNEKATHDLEALAQKWRLPVLFGLLLLGAALRLYHLTHGWGSHPDERHMVMVAEKLSFSSLNPQSFAYGSLPYYLLWLSSSFGSLFYGWLATYDGLFVVGRVICVLFGLGGIWLVSLLGRSVTGRDSVGLLAAALLGLNVFHLQLSRFYTVDVVLATICSGALLVAVRLSREWNFKFALAGGVLLGFAAATKISALSLLLPFFVAWLLYCSAHRAFLNPRVVAAGALILIAGLLAFALAEPYAFLDSAQFLKDIREQTDMVKGLWRPPYTIQYAGTVPYFYHLKQMWHYTMGWPLALCVFAGVLLAVFRQIRHWHAAEVVLLVFILGTFIAIGGYQVKFPRYLLPLYPPLFVFAAQFLLLLAGVWREEDEKASVAGTSSVSSVRPAEPRSAALRALLTGSVMKKGVAGLVLVLFTFGLMYTFRSGESGGEKAAEQEEVFEEPDRDEAPLDMFTGGRGLRRGRFNTARDLDVCASGEVVVPDSNNHRIQVFDSQGAFLRMWGEKGDAPGQFNEPHSVICAKDGVIYVLDSWNGRVQTFTPDGKFLAVLNAEGGLFGPRGFVLKASQLFLVDSGHSQVIVMSTTGATLRKFGKRGSGKGEFLEPVGAAVDSSGSLWLVDPGNNRLQILSPEGVFVAQILIPGWSGDNLKEAYIDFDAQDNLYLADPVSGNILRLRKGAGEFENIASARANLRGIALRDSDILVTVDNQVLSLEK